MIGASKILTVSYGTFSCTLEGFDEPFNTMKAIAEYFRDLAADDRYFGAEPPTPDAAMLHKIAEREIHRRVEAKIQENGVVLRAGNLISDNGNTPLRPAPITEPVADTPRVAAPATPPAASDVPMSESVAAKLARIRSAVAQAAVPAYTEDQHAEVQTVVATSEPATEPAIEAEDTFAADSEAEAMALHALLAQDSQPEDEVPTAEAEVIDEPVEITELVMESADLSLDTIEQPVETPDEIEASDADDALRDTLAGFSDMQDGFADAEPSQDPAEERGFDEAFDEDDLDGDILADLIALDGADQADAQADAVDVDTADTDQETDDEDDFSGILASLASDHPTPPQPESATPEAEAFDARISAALGTREIAAEEDVAAEPQARAEAEIEPALRMRARVIKVRRMQMGDADKLELSTETRQVSEMRTARPRPLPQSDALSPEAEADLMRQLGEVESDAPKTPVTPVRPVRPIRAARQQVRDTGQTLAPLPEKKDEDADVRRLMAQTDTEMGVPENRRRLSAIAHLKAAVAATVADRRIGGTPRATDEERADPYRNDLSQMVRPSTNTATQQTPAPAAPKAAPLVLVSEQRVTPPELGMQSRHPMAQTTFDEDEDLADLDDENIFSDGKGFAEFADRLGANSLQDMLEAAAAYTSCVEGRPHFSRPQLMRQVSVLAGEEEYVREDGLRGFGNLLRSGTIAKIKRGQYALSEDSHFLAEARKFVG